MNSFVKVTDLANMLSVSQVTLRKDLDYFENRGILHRTHGYVSLDGADDTGRRIAFSYANKIKIARAAAHIIKEGETVLVESGSCCALFAEELALSKKNITIVTNSSFIAASVSKLPGAKVILLGGYFQPESKVLVGSITSRCVETICFDKFFLGVDGFKPELGFTGKDFLRVETSIELSKRASKIYVLTESAKFNRSSAFELLSFDKINGVFTDNNIPDIAESVMIKNNVHVHKVPASEDYYVNSKKPTLVHS